MKTPVNLRKQSLYFVLGGVLALGTVLGMTIQSVISDDNTYQNLMKLEEAFSVITKRYVEDVDTSKLSRDAIEGMLAGLDPHSVFIDAERMREVREGFDASFEGIGISYEWTEGRGGKDSLTVLNPIPGGPSEEAGLRAGDRIVNVDGENAVGWKREDVEKYLKGPKGTKVNVSVKRPRFPEMLEFSITRDKIPIYTVDAFHMVDDETGYIRLNRFARTTREEVRSALMDLKGKGMQRLIFDLRGNSGGYMNMAVSVADEFLSGKQMIVYTRSRHQGNNEEHLARNGGLFEDKPLIILVDENSASASEIVAGALQDHDRALLIGRRTFGKGLVQQQYPLPDGSVLQLTTSRYYTPAGRLIQTPYDMGDREAYYHRQRSRYDSIGTSASIYGDLDQMVFDDIEAGKQSIYHVAEYLDLLADSLKFRTDGGRTVLGGGGILPDYLVTSPSSTLMRTVFNFDHEFVRSWMDQHDDIRSNWEHRQAEFNRSFRIDDKVWDAFWAYAQKERGLRIAAAGEDEGTEAETPGRRTTRFTPQEVEAEREVLETRLKAYMARRIWGVAAWYPVIHQIDPVLQQAMRLWEPAGQLALTYEKK